MDEATEPKTIESSSAAAESAEASVAAVGVTKSKTTGRIRMRLDRQHRSPDNLARLKTQLEQDERVSEVVINERTGSVTVKHAHGHDGHGLLAKALKEAELVTEVALEIEPPEEEEGGGESGQAKLDQQVADLMYRFDRWLYRRSGGKIHARGRVVPLGIAGLGVAQIAAYGISLEMLPGPVMFWIAFDIHRRFTKEHPYSLTDDETADSGATTGSDASEMVDRPGPLTGGAAPAAA